MVELLELGLVETLADSEIKSSGSVAGKNRSISFSARTRGTDSTYIILTSFACGRVRRQYRLFCIPTLLIVFFFQERKARNRSRTGRKPTQAVFYTVKTVTAPVICLR